MKVLWLCLSMQLISSSLMAQPFGIEMGTAKQNLKIEEEILPFSFTIVPPRTHDEFESYVVVATPNAGVCLIRSHGKTIRNDAFGTEVRVKFSEIISQMETNYGKPRLNNFLQTGSIWNDPKYWTMSIFKNERSHQAVWDLKTNPKMPQNIIQILLTVNALSSDNAYVTLQYRYKNFQDCDQERKKAAAGAL